MKLKIQISNISIFRLGIDHIWTIGVILVFVFFVSLRPLVPNDFWWHIKIGEIIYNLHVIPESNIFSWALNNQYPYFYGAWLGELLFYILYYFGRITVIVFSRNLFALIAFSLISLESYRKSKSWRITGVVMLFVCAMGLSNVIVRPQIWAWIPFTITYLVISKYVDHVINPGWLMVIPILMVFWANVHGSYILGLTLIGIYLVGESANKIFEQRMSLSWKEISYLIVVGFSSLLATLINPKLTGGFDYVINMLTNLPSQKLGTEWQSPIPDDSSMVFFFLSILLILIVFTYSRYKPSWTNILLLSGFLWLAFTGIRYVIWFGMIMAPILSKGLGILFKDKSWMIPPARNFINVILAITLLLSVILIQPWGISHFPGMIRSTKQIIFDDKNEIFLSSTTPIGGTDYLKQHPGGKLFNDMAYGSYLIWAIPEQQVFIDPRIDLYPYQFWLDYIDITLGVRSIELLEKYGATRVFLDKKEESELETILKKNKEWKLEYEDEYSQIWSQLY